MCRKSIVNPNLNTMKKILKVLVLFVAVASMATMTSCKKDNAAQIVGKWQFEQAAVSVSVDDPELQQMINEYISWMESELNSENRDLTIEFKSDKTCVSSSEGYSEIGTWSIDGDKITIDGESMTIKELTNKKLVLEETEAYDEEGIAGSVTVSLEFKRI